MSIDFDFYSQITTSVYDTSYETEKNNTFSEPANKITAKTSEFFQNKTIHTLKAMSEGNWGARLGFDKEGKIHGEISLEGKWGGSQDRKNDVSDKSNDTNQPEKSRDHQSDKTDQKSDKS